MTTEELITRVADDFESGGITVHRDARRVLELACMNQLESGRLESVEEIALVASLVTPDLVSAYRFKFGDEVMTFGRAIRLIGDITERWNDLVNQRRGA